MKHSLFIRSYAGDIWWLEHCLRSIERHAKGFDEVVIAIPRIDRAKFADFNFRGARVIWIKSEILHEGYLSQQVTKIHADEYCFGEYITHIDSDCIVNRPFHADELLCEGKPFLVMREWKDAGSAICWKPVTDKALLIDSKWETMCCLPITYYRQTYHHFRGHFRKIQGITITDYVKTKCSGNQFSEFNALGNFCVMFNPGYHLLIAGTPMDVLPRVFTQHFSWGGITPEILEKINATIDQ